MLLGMWGALHVSHIHSSYHWNIQDILLAAWACFGAYESAAASPWSWRAPTLIQAAVPLLQISLAWYNLF